MSPPFFPIGPIDGAELAALLIAGTPYVVAVSLAAWIIGLILWRRK